MPAIPDQHIHAEAKDGTKFYYAASTFVDSEGVFSVKLDDKLKDIAEKMRELDGWYSKIQRLKHFRGSYRVMGSDLKTCVNFIVACAEEFIAVEETTERIIVYGAIMDISFWKTKSGEIKPNGAHRVDGKWWECKTHKTRFHEDRDGYFAVGLGAMAVDKITAKRKTGDVVRYERVRGDNDENSPLEKLNSFRCAPDPEQEGAKEMPYSDEAAIFFYDMLIGLCKVAERIDDFISDKKKVEHAIATKSQFLLK